MKHRTFIVHAAVVDMARAMCVGLAGTAGDGMFTTGLSSTGNAPATHYVSSGPISDDMAALLPCTTVDAEGVATTAPGQPDAVPALAAEEGITATEQQITALYSSIDVSDQEPFQAMTRLGLEIVQVPLP